MDASESPDRDALTFVDALAVAVPAGHGFGLRPLAPTDAERFAEALNDREVRHWMHGIPRPYTPDDAGRAIREGAARRSDAADPWWTWALTDGQDRLMGKISLADHDGSAAHLSYWLHPDARGRGWMTEAARAVTTAALASDRLALDCVLASVAAQNHPSRRVLERAGFALLESHHDYTMGDGSTVSGVRYASRGTT